MKTLQNIYLFNPLATHVWQHTRQENINHLEKIVLIYLIYFTCRIWFVGPLSMKKAFRDRQDILFKWRYELFRSEINLSFIESIWYHLMDHVWGTSSVLLLEKMLDCVLGLNIYKENCVAITLPPPHTQTKIKQFRNLKETISNLSFGGHWT